MHAYGIYSNKRRGAYLIFRATSAALIRGRLLLTFLSQMRRLIEGGAYSSKYGIFCNGYVIYATLACF